MSQHTPGPWRVTANVLRIEESDTGRLIAAMPSQDHHGTRLINARLIAAAPRMIEVLRQLDLWASAHPRKATFSGLSEARDLLKEIEK